MAKYKFLKVLGTEPDGYVIKIDRLSGEGPEYNSDCVYEVYMKPTETGMQGGVRKLNTDPTIGAKIKFNPALIVYESELTDSSPVVKFIENGEKKLVQEPKLLVR